jgi:tetratricopeptide (TPR) repeat protein
MLVRACHRRSRCAGPLTIFVVICLSSGCRMWQRVRTQPDEAIAQTRQLSLQGQDAQQQGRWDEAEALFASAVAKCPRDERARCGYAEALWQRGAHDEAVAHMEEAVKLSGHDPERLVQLGNMYLARGEFDRAAHQASRAIAAGREQPSAWALQGHVLKAQGNDAEALAAFHRALSYQEQFPQVQLALAEIYSRQNRPQRALATLQALAEDYPPGQAPVEVLVQQAFALRELGRHQDATRMLAWAAQRTNPSPDLLYELGRSQLLAGDAPSARVTIAAALDRDPRHVASLALREELVALGDNMAVIRR